MDNNFETTQNKETQNSERTFTQEEVEEIIGKRLARERKKYERETGTTEPDEGKNDVSKKESELISRELQIMAKEKLLEMNMPLELASCLKYDDKESLEKAIETINKIYEPKESPRAWGRRQSSSMIKKVDNVRDAFGLE